MLGRKVRDIIDDTGFESSTNSKHVSSTIETYLDLCQKLPIVPRYFGVKKKLLFQISTYFLSSIKQR